jgi:nitric-oxide synthase, bacterial
MAHVLLGDIDHGAWPLLVPSSESQGSWGQPPSVSAGDRVVVLVGYEQLGDLELRLARLGPGLSEADVLLVAPDVPPTSPLARPLAAAQAQLPRAARLVHAPPAEVLLAVLQDLRASRTLSLSLPERPVPLVAWGDVARVAATWWTAPPAALGAGLEASIGGPEELDGEGLAEIVSELLVEVLDPAVFVALRLRELDENGDGVITVEEATRFLVGLGYSPPEALALTQVADRDGDGTISLDEFSFGLKAQVAEALADEQRTVVWHRTLPHLLCDRWVALGKGFTEAHALAEHLATTRSQQEQPTLRGELTVRDVLRPRALSLVDLFVLPGRGLLSRGEGRFGEARPRAPALLWEPGDPQLAQPASFAHLKTLDGQHLHSRRSPQGAVEARWLGETPTERLSFGEGDEARALELAGDRLVGVACRGRWPGLRDAMVELMEQRAIRPWERALFREFGALRTDQAEDPIDPEEMICNCIGVRRSALVAAADAGAKTLPMLAERTRATTVCGGCTPLVEGILGSPKLKVAEVRHIERLGRDFVSLTLQPVEGPPLPSRAGQHIVVQGRIQARWTTRAYSLTNRAGGAVPYEITVKREEMGLFSRWLSDRAGHDSLFRCSAPMGKVSLGDDDRGPIFVFAGGIGVTPGMAIARTLATDGSGRRLRLDWSARRSSDFIFEAELDALSLAHEHINWNRRLTTADGRLNAADVAARYAYEPGAVAFVCGPNRFGTDVVALLRGAGWPEEAIRVEVFSSNVDDEGTVKAPPPRPAAPTADGLAVPPPVQHTSFFLDLRESRPVLLEAEAFLGQMYQERGLGAVFAERLSEVRDEVNRTGTYTHTLDELTFGARLAWRNATRCIGRFFWNHLVVRDMRHLEAEEEIFAAIVDHLRLATNGGDLISTMTVFRPGPPDIRIYNTQLLRYAGYRQADGSVLGDPANLELTHQAMELGWRGRGTRFDILPIIIRVGDRPARWFEIPEDAILRIPLEHPTFPWFAELGLEWYALPAVSEIALDLGGIAYRCTPFNGFYMVTEIGARNLSDDDRYNQLPLVAARMGLDTSSPSTLWKDRAMVELNVAVLHSFQKRQVRMLDHHSVCDYFLQFEKQELAAGRKVHGDWSWLVPPLSGSLSPIWDRADLQNVIYKPMYGYQANAWKADEPVPAHEGPIPPCPHLRGRRLGLFLRRIGRPVWG